MTFFKSRTCVLLVLLELASGRPQYADKGLLNATFSLNLSRPIRQAAKDTNRTKEERILTTSNRRGSVAFSEQDIVFPDSLEVIFQPLPRIDGAPKCADGSTFCENFDAYPYLHLKDVLKRNNVNNDFYFGEDEAPPEIEKRIGVDDGTFVCGAIDRVVFPKVGKNKDNQWKYVVNQGKTDGYVQGVRTETCRHLNSPCDIIGELPEGYKTACKQKYIYRRLLSLNENGMPIPDTFQLPSACCCSYKRDMSFLTRIGKAGTSPVTET